jgi:flagellar biosynthesis protein FlhA
VSQTRFAKLREETEGEDAKDAKKAASDADVPGIEPIEVRVGSGLTELSQGSETVLAQRIVSLRSQFASEFGIGLPPARFVVDGRLGPTAYEIDIHGVAYGRGELVPDRTLAIHPTGDTKHIDGIETREPTYGLPAVWIDESQKDKARAARFTLVDPATVFITHLSETLKQHCANFVTRAETEKILNRVREAQPGLVEDVIPTVLGVVDVQKVLQSLLREKVSLRHAEAIIETLADVGRTSKDALVLTEAVRQRLGAVICQQLMGDGKALNVLTLDPGLEQSLRESTDGTSEPRIDPRLAEQMIGRMMSMAEQMMRSNLLPVLLCAPDLRKHLRSLTERVLPHMRILSVTEVPNVVPLKAFGSIALPNLKT